MCVKRPLGQTGQATFEYLFLIFFTIVLVSGFVYQFNGAVQSYFKSYFAPDGYLACLIEKGLLPGESNDEGGCDAPSFDLNNGKQRKVASVTFDKGGVHEYHSIPGDTAANRAGRTDEKGPGNVVPYGKGTGNSAFQKNNKPPAVTKKGPNTGNDGFSTTVGSGDGGDAPDGQGGRTGMVPYSGHDNTNAIAKKGATVPATGRDLKTPRQLAEEKAARKLASQKKADGLDLSIGKILKWIFLILLLFAIFFFIGSQIVAVSNGGKKRR